MTNEVKEILEKPNVYSFNDECYLYFGDYNKLKDYITNLQEENEILDENNKQMQFEMSITWKKHDKLQQRIDKAIKYINKFYDKNEEVIDQFGFAYSYKYIKEILQGEDK